MKPDWDKLMAEYKDHASILIADVDCTAGGKDLCSEMGVRGYPTIKSGSPEDLQDYKGGRDLKSLKDHAATLKPSCSPANIDLCDDDKKKEIGRLQALSADDREKLIKEKTDAIEKLEADFKKFVEGLQKSYEEANTKKEADVKAVMDSGLGLLKAVHASEKKAKGNQEL